MPGLTAVNLVWWLVGGAAAAVGIVQIISALRGPRERRSSAVIGALLALLGGLALAMPFFGEGAPPPGKPRAAASADDSLTDLLDALASPGARLDEVKDRIIARAHEDESGDAMREMLERCTRGDAAARPPGTMWQRRYARLLGAGYAILTEEGRSIDEPLRQSLLNLPVDWSLTTRERWPTGVDPVVRVHLRHFWPGHHLRLRARPRIEGVFPALFASDDDWELSGASLPPGEHTLLIEVELERLSAAAGDPMTPDAASIEIVGRSVVSLPVRVVATMDEALPPVSMTSMDAVLRDGLAITLERGKGSSFLTVDPGATAVALFDDVAIGARLDVIAGGNVLATAACSWRGGMDGDRSPLRIRLSPDDGAAIDDADGPLTVRLRSDAALAVLNAGATRHWSGEVTVPLR